MGFIRKIFGNSSRKVDTAKDLQAGSKSHAAAEHTGENPLPTLLTSFAQTGRQKDGTKSGFDNAVPIQSKDAKKSVLISEKRFLKQERLVKRGSSMLTRLFDDDFQRGSSILSDASAVEALITAVGSGDTGTVLKYKQKEVPLGKVKDEKGSTLIHVAAREGQVQMLQFLLVQSEMQKKINARDRASRTALHIASAIGNAVIVGELVASKANLQAVDSCQWTPLHWAAFGEHPVSCEILLDARADPRSLNEEGKTAIQLYGTGGPYRPSPPAVFKKFLPGFQAGHETHVAQDRDAGSPPGTIESAHDSGFCEGVPSIQGHAPLEESNNDWVGFQADDGRTYYWNRRSDTTTWQRPVDVAVNWYGFKDADGAQFYWNAIDESTTWILPELGELSLHHASHPGSAAEVAIFGKHRGHSSMLEIDYAAIAAALLDALRDASTAQAELQGRANDGNLRRVASIKLSYDDERPVLDQVRDQVTEELRSAIESGDTELVTSVIVHARSVGVAEDEIKLAEQILEEKGYYQYQKGTVVHMGACDDDKETLDPPTAMRAVKRISSSSTSGSINMVEEDQVQKLVPEKLRLEVEARAQVNDASTRLASEDERPLSEQVRDQVVAFLDAIKAGDRERAKSVIVHARSVGFEGEIKSALRALYAKKSKSEGKTLQQEADACRKKKQEDPTAKARELAERQLGPALATSPSDELSSASTAAEYMFCASQPASAVGWLPGDPGLIAAGPPQAPEPIATTPPKAKQDQTQKNSAIIAGMKEILRKEAELDMARADKEAAGMNLILRKAHAELLGAEARERAQEVAQSEKYDDPDLLT